jgi:hypothetical protein
MPCSPLKFNWRFGGTLSPQSAEYKILLRPVFFSGLFSDSEGEATYATETSADFQPTTRYYILEDRTLWNNSYYDLIRCKSLYLREFEIIPADQTGALRLEKYFFFKFS